jgi:hypothetical protein
MVGNTFVNNNGLKGIIIIDKNDNNDGSLIVQNTFLNNSAIMESNVLNLRSKTRTTNLLSNSYNANNLTCGGFKLLDNIF